MKRLFRVWDLVPLALILLLALTLWLTLRGGGRAQRAEVYVDNTLCAELVLPQDGQTEVQGYTVVTQRGTLHLSYSSLGVWVTEADCPDGVCVRTGKISREGEAIVCVPLGVCVTLGEGEWDGVTG